MKPRKAPRAFGQLTFDDLTIAEKVKVRVCQATAAGGRCDCWDGSLQTKRPSCETLNGYVNRIITDVQEDMRWTIEGRRR